MSRLLSLPSRERGLKSHRGCRCPAHRSSLPSRERGLKSQIIAKPVVAIPSLPSRERGLKCAGAPPEQRYRHVAPFAGAWIEMTEPESRRQAPEARRSLRGSVD